ncbi:MAG: substrate-binding domain-containing protein [Anaerolineaceae bacterium]|nr:substrate-binding domain-containing protein [Anaerolineaceae bacterium]
MNTKRIQILVSLLTIGVLLLAACTPAATPTAAPQAQAPAAPAAAAPAAGSGWCSNVHIVFFPGGPQGGVFAVNVYNGAVQAASDLGAKVDYVWSNWDTQKMIQQFQESAATKPDGIAIMGHPGDQSFDPLIDQAEKNGIIVTSQNTNLPLAQGKYSANGFGYVGAVNYTAGQSLANEAIKRFGLKSGDRTMVWGLLSQPGRGERTKGIVDALKAAGATVDYIEIDAATNADPAAGTATFSGYVSSHPDVKAIFLDHGGLTATAETYMKAANKNAGDIKIAGFDMSPATVTAIQGGWTSLVIDQQEWLQGYLPILQICLTKVYGFSGLDINTGAGFVDKSNVDFIAPLAQKNIR